MSKKNFKVETTQSGQTPKQDTKHAFATVNVKKDKTPTGKVKTKEDAEKRKAAHEEQYRNFRISMLKRRAKRMGLTEEQTNVKIEELKKQMDTPALYQILITFNESNYDMVKEALFNEGVVCAILTNTYGWIDGDKETLDDIRKVLSTNVKIIPYAKKHPSILPTSEQPKKKKKPSGNSKATASKSKASRKAAAVAAHLSRKEHAKQQKEAKNKKVRAIEKAKKLFKKRVEKAQKAAQKASKKQSGTVVRLKPKKGYTSLKKAFMMKKAALKGGRSWRS